MANIYIAYGTQGVAFTITLTSLANNGQYASAAVDNTSNLFLDALVQVKVKSAGSSTSSAGYVNIYAFATADNGTDYSDGLTPSGSVTLTSPPNLKRIGTINVVANSTTYTSDPMSVAQAFGGVLPAKWGIVVENKSGATLDASVGSAWYQGIYNQAI